MTKLVVSPFNVGLCHSFKINMSDEIFYSGQLHVRHFGRLASFKVPLGEVITFQRAAYLLNMKSVASPSVCAEFQEGMFSGWRLTGLPVT